MTIKFYVSALCSACIFFFFLDKHTALFLSAIALGQHSKQTDRKLMKARDKRDITQNNVCNTYVHTWQTVLGHFYEGVDRIKREAFGLLWPRIKI